MRYWCASHELLLLWDCSDTAVTYLASIKAPHWSLAMEMATYLPSRSASQTLFTGLHCLSNHIIKLVASDVSVSSGRVMVHASIINSSNGVSSILLLLPASHCYYLHQPWVLKIWLEAWYFGPEYGAKHANSHVVLICLVWTLIQRNSQRELLERWFGGIRGALYAKNCVERRFLEL